MDGFQLAETIRTKHEKINAVQKYFRVLPWISWPMGLEVKDL